MCYLYRQSQEWRRWLEQFLCADTAFYEFFVDAAVNDETVGKILFDYYGRKLHDKNKKLGMFMWHIKALRVAVSIRVSGSTKTATVILGMTNKLTAEEELMVIRQFGEGPQLMRSGYCWKTIRKIEAKWFEDMDVNVENVDMVCEQTGTKMRWARLVNFYNVIKEYIAQWGSRGKLFHFIFYYIVLHLNYKYILHIYCR